MSYKIIITDLFKKEARRLVRKYPSLKTELQILSEQLIINPFLGIHLGNSVYKIRISIRSKGKGKRGGARIISKLRIVKNKIYLIYIYSKGERNDISEQELKNILSDIKD